MFGHGAIGQYAFGQVQVIPVQANGNVLSGPWCVARSIAYSPGPSASRINSPGPGQSEQFNPGAINSEVGCRGY